MFKFFLLRDKFVKFYEELVNHFEGKSKGEDVKDLNSIKEMLDDEVLEKIIRKKKKRNDLANTNQTCTDDTPILVIGDIQGDISIFYKVHKLCEKKYLKNPLNPSSNYENEEESNKTYGEESNTRTREEKPTPRIIVLGDIINPDRKESQWNRCIFALFALAEIIFNTKVYLIIGRNEIKEMETSKKNHLDQLLQDAYSKMCYCVRIESHNSYSIVCSHRGIVDNLKEKYGTEGKNSLNENDKKIMIFGKNIDAPWYYTDRDFKNQGNESLRLLLNAYFENNVFNNLSHLSYQLK